MYLAHVCVYVRRGDGEGVGGDVGGVAGVVEGGGFLKPGCVVVCCLVV